MMRATPIQRLVDYRTQEHYYKDRLTERTFQRIVGGLAFPFNSSSGHAVVLGEILRKDPEMHQHHVFVLGETKSDDFQELLSRVAMLQDRTLCKEWMTPMDNNNVLLVDDYNEEHRYRMRKAPVELNSPPMYDRSEKSEVFRFYDRLVAKRTTKRKTLHFGDCEVAGHYQTLQPADLKRHPEEFPPVAAFLYALAELDLGTMGNRYQGQTAKVADTIGGW
ncbi:hypothetical protein SYK_06710 [Pseudodesulfovibrio nedwellii]|uniref:Uncharacterized protein n=1 Tax=Pseudodesulfovibrio nedwellii TaxID=2973072 RepID=A0ABM8AYC5_9BACT|nr:hypothetical protein [Pseudodesulfovibrio nedwellii]BDQ36311.1 hypothetical protein SYK_06710 [Pseudodesulfovibrio nedwellii]